MYIQVTQAQPDDAPIIAEMVGELLHEIMAAIGSKVFTFDLADTKMRAKTWLTDRTYTVFLAHEGGGPVTGFLALYKCYALYAGGAFGTIPELYVRMSFRSRGVGARLMAEAKHYARSQ
jgi:GNAT superfamily N-acetyltransferase